MARWRTGFVAFLIVLFSGGIRVSVNPMSMLFVCLLPVIRKLARPAGSAILSLALLQAGYAQQIETQPWMTVQETTRQFSNVQQDQEIDPYTGALKISNREVYLPGNGDLDITVLRIYDTDAMRGATGVNPVLSYKWVGLGMGWSLNVAPKVIITPFATDSSGPPLKPDENYYCTGTGYAATYMLEHIDGRSEPLVHITTGSLRTATNWELNCSGTPYFLRSPEGIKHELGIRHGDAANVVGGGTIPSRPVTVLHTTKIIDTNGNFIDIAYQYLGAGFSSFFGHQIWAAYLPSSITSSDGRSITFSYDPGLPDPGGYPPRLLSITSGGITLRQYTHVNNKVATVVRPDSTKWEYDYWATAGAPSVLRLKSVKLPTGGLTTYEYSSSSFRPCAASIGQVPQLVSFVQVSKATSSDGGVWTYAYARSNTQNQYDVTTITTPAGTETYKHIGVGYFTPNPPGTADLMYSLSCSKVVGDPWKLGLMVEKSVAGQSAETYNWSSRLFSTNYFQGIKSRVMIRNFPLTVLFNYYVPVLTSQVKTVNGAVHTTIYSNYDAYGNPVTIAEAGPNGGNRTTTRTYLNDTAKWIIGRVKDESFTGSSTTRLFDGYGNLTSITSEGVTTGYTYDSQGNIATTTQPRGLVYTYSNYKRGTPQTEAQPEAVSLARVVDNMGNVTSETNGNGFTTTYTYDGLNRVTSVDYPFGNTKTITYTANSQTATRGGLVETIQYDGFGRPSSVTLGGIVTTFTHDPLGRRTFESNPDSASGTTYVYDALDRVIRINNADSTFQLNSFGAGTQSVTDERGKVTTATFRSYGDPSQRFLMSVTSPEPSTNLSLVRNTKDLVTSATQGGFTRTYGYNSNYYLTSVVNPETGTTTYGRDAAGNMTTRSVGTSGTTTYVYDGRNRLTTVTYPGITPAVTNVYTKTDKLLRATSTAAVREYLYNANDNLTGQFLTIDSIAFNTAYTYNDNDQLNLIVYPRSVKFVYYTPDVLGRPSLVTGYVTSLSYWPSGQIKQINYANGTVTNYGQNARLWPNLFGTKKGATSYIDTGYLYDGVGNLTHIADSVDNASYGRVLTYDNINRLTGINGPWGTGTIAYSGVGNISSQTLGTYNVAYTYNTGNRLSAVSGSKVASYTYDAYGNIATGAGNTYTYDGVPNLRCINCANPATKIEYAYDGTGQRVSVTKAGVKTYEVYDLQGNLLIEFTPSQGNKLVEYIYLGNKRIAQRVTP